MKTLQFWVIPLMVMLLSSCGGEEKVTKENGDKILQEVLGYPFILTTSDKFGFGSNDQTASMLNTLDIVRIAKIGGRTPYFADYQELFRYMPDNSSIFECASMSNLPTRLCGVFAVAKVNLGDIVSVSKESEEGIITVDFKLHVNYTDFGISYGKHTVPSLMSDYTGALNIVSDLQQKTNRVKLQRTEEGWMILERDEFKDKISKHYRFSVCSPQLVPQIDNILSMQ